MSTHPAGGPAEGAGDGGRGDLAELVAVMDRLRSPGGCPWDAEQTHASLAPYAVEEAYELVEAVETGTSVDVREELGDLLLQVVFHSRVAQEAPDGERFDVDDVAAGVVAKLVHRHPHVFADPTADAAATTAADVEAGWEARKQAEKGRASAFDGVPLALPALARAAKVLRRASGAGLLEVDGGTDAGVEVGARQTAGAEPTVGEQLLGVVAQALSRDPGLDVEGALRGAVRDLEGQLRAREAARTT